MITCEDVEVDVGPDGDARGLVGSVVTGVSSSWYVEVASSERSLIHVWMWLDGMATQLHTLNGVWIKQVEVYEPYDVPELGGRVVIEDSAGEPWDGLVGRVITDVGRLLYELRGSKFATGWLLDCNGVKVAVMDLGDDLIAQVWPLSGQVAERISLEAV